MAAQTPTPRILVVEDNEDHAALIEIAFANQTQPVDLRIENSLAAARSTLEAESIDIIVADNRLSDGVGMDLLPGHGEKRRYPIILMTGQGDEKIAVEAIKNGAFDYLVKSPEVLSQMPRTVFRALREWQNIVKRQSAEIRSREFEDRLRTIIDTAPVGIALKDTDFRYVIINERIANWIGTSQDEIVGKTVWDILPNNRDYCQFIDRLDRETMESTETLEIEIEAPPVHGRQRYWSILQKAVTDARGQIVGVLVIISDITARVAGELEKEALQRQLLESQKLEAVGQMAGGIAHDFNNILGAILGFASFISEDNPEGSSERKFATHILRASERAKQLISQILTFSRRTETRLVNVNIDQAFQEAEGLLRATLPATTELKFVNGASGWTIQADETQLNQVLINLCVNANDALSGAHGVVTVRAEPAEYSDFEQLHSLDPRETNSKAGRFVAGKIQRDPPYVQMIVQDSGPGISPDTMERVFEPFFSTKRREHGTGLGLSVVHGIVLGHEGALIVDSVSGEGTTFHIFLPSGDSTLHSEAHVQAADRAIATGRILVVDDDLDFGDMASTGLERLGFEVAVCDDPVTAWEEFQSAPHIWDAVVTDQTMPKMKGSELVFKIKSVRPELPCVICSGFNHDLTAEECQALGIDDYADKPILPEELAQRLSALISRV